MSLDLYSIAGVIYENQSLLSSVRKDADKKFGKNSYTKNLWVLKEYKKRGGKVKYEGKKPSRNAIKKQVTASVDIEAEIVRKDIPFEIITANESSDPEIKELVEDLETYAYCVEMDEETDDGFVKDFVEEAAEKKKNVKLNKPFRTPGGPKKFAVYVKNEKGNVVLVRFGDPKMEIKRDDPERRKNFRARHNCDNPGPKTSAKYWSCRMWSSKPVSKVTASEDESSFTGVFENVEEISD